VIRIRKARVADEYALLDLQRQCLPYDRPLGYGDAKHWWIALDGEQPVAFASVSRSHQYSDVWYLSRAGVAPCAQGQGLQKRLIRARLRAAERAGMSWCVTDTLFDNVQSMNSLMSCGFKSYRPRKPWALKQSVYWRRSL
jgi:GNAT superfamily N-acetyltransferase